jgi:hypothetical protein
MKGWLSGKLVGLEQTTRRESNPVRCTQFFRQQAHSVMCDRQVIAKPLGTALSGSVLSSFGTENPKTDAENPQLYRLLIKDLEAAAPSCFD